MASLLKHAFNAARIRLGKAPLIVTTSKSDCTVTSDSPLLNLFGMKNTEMTQTVPGRFVAEAREGYRKPELQVWDVSIHIDGYSKQPYRPMTYDAMLSFMKSRELRAAAEVGITGTADEVIARRKPVVARNNILKFV